MAEPGTDIETDLPAFRPNVPHSLLKNASEFEKEMYEQNSIQRQQNEFIIRQFAVVNRKFLKGDEQRTRMELDMLDVRRTLVPIVSLRDSITAKWTLIAAVCGLVIGPVLLAMFGAWCMAWFAKNIK